MDRAAETTFADRVCELLTQLSSGQCPITDEMIQAEPDENNASVLSGLQLLWEDLNYQAERRAMAERELRQREARFRALFVQARVCIWDVDLSEVVAALPSDADGLAATLDSVEATRRAFAKAKLVGVNRQSLEVFAARDEAQLLEGLTDVIGEESHELMSSMLGALAGGARHFEEEGVLYALNGTPLRVILGLSTAEGGYEQSIVTISDVTPLHQAREAAHELAQLRADALARVSHEVERLFHAVSHDLRAPLRGVINLVEWAEEDLATNDVAEVKAHLGMLRQRIERLDTMLSDLLSFARVGRAKHPVEEVEVSTLLDEIRRGLVMVPDGFAVEWDEMPVLVTQKTLLSQVFINLVSNALKHHHRPEGRIVIRHREVDGVHEFSVADDGPGIPEEYREKIFGMFATLKPRDEVEGSGMGLAFVHKLIMQRRGTITVTETPGGGATFLFTWPVEQPD